MYKGQKNKQRFSYIVAYLSFSIQQLAVKKFHLYKYGFYNYLTTTTAGNLFLEPILARKKGLRNGQRFVNLFIKNASIFLIGILFLSPFLLSAQIACLDCEVQVPDSLQVDTFYLQELPEGAFRLPYEAGISFRLPVNTSEVLYLDPTLPPNIGIGKIKIKSITNLPAGLIWSPNQEEYDLPDERNGCVSICGMPLQFGLFKVEITVTAQVSVLSRDATFTRDLFIAPPQSDNQGFSMENNIGCGSTTVSFTNNNPSNGRAGFSYAWDFGNGVTSTEEIPMEQTYDTPGTYPVNYEVVIDTLGAILTEVSIVEAGCDDILGKPDFFIRLYDALDTLIFENTSLDNMDAPVSFPLNIKVGTGIHRLEVWDNDSGLGFSDDLCGIVSFDLSNQDTLREGELGVLLTIVHTPDTVRVQDSVVVLAVPTAPTIDLAATYFCEGDSMLLTASYDNNTTWYKDGLPIENATSNQFAATNSGEYHVSYINEAGCIAFSEPVELETITPPAAPVFSNTNNVLRLFNPAILPSDFELRWYQENNLLEETDMNLCIAEDGKYALELVDAETGCATLFETSIVVDDAIDCTTATADLSEYLSEVLLYPNPTAGAVSIDFTVTTPLEAVQLRVVNLLGQAVYQQRFTQLQGRQQLAINLENQAAGLYLVVLESEVGVSSWKLRKE